MFVTMLHLIMCMYSQALMDAPQLDHPLSLSITLTCKTRMFSIKIFKTLCLLNFLKLFMIFYAVEYYAYRQTFPCVSSTQYNRNPNDLGELQLWITYAKRDGSLNIHVIQARGLRPREKHRPPDPFVKCYILPGRM